MVFHDFADAVDVALGFVVFYLQIVQLVGALFEESQEALFLFLIEILQLGHHARQHLPDFAHVLGADVVQGVLGEIRDFLLAAGTVLQHHLGIGDVNLGGEIVYHFLLRRGKHYLGHLLGGLRRRRHFRSLRLGEGLKGQGRGLI